LTYSSIGIYTNSSDIARVVKQIVLVASSRPDFIAVKRACGVEVDVAGVGGDGGLDSQDALSIEVFGNEGNGKIGGCAEAAASEGCDQDLREE